MNTAENEAAAVLTCAAKQIVASRGRKLTSDERSDAWFEVTGAFFRSAIKPLGLVRAEEIFWAAMNAAEAGL